MLQGKANSYPKDVVLEWSSNNSAVVAVEQSGLLRTMGSGRADIFVAFGSIYTVVPVTVDSEAPEILLPADMVAWSPRDVVVALTVTEELTELQEVTYSTDEAAPQAGRVILENDRGEIRMTGNGSYTLTVTAVDALNNRGAAATKILIDKITPKLTISGVPTGPVTRAILNVRVSAGPSGWTLTCNGETLESNRLTITENGAYTFTAVSGAGLQAQETVVIDTIKGKEIAATEEEDAFEEEKKEETGEETEDVEEMEEMIDESEDEDGISVLTAALLAGALLLGLAGAGTTLFLRYRKRRVL